LELCGQNIGNWDSPRPDFDIIPDPKRTISFFKGPNFPGPPELILGPGAYSNIHKLQINKLGQINFGDMISSVRFNHEATDDTVADLPPEGDAVRIDAVPLIIEIFTHHDDDGVPNKTLTVVENVPDIRAAFGEEFNDAIWFVRVRPGSHYAGEIARLHRDPSYKGGHIDIPAEGTYLSLQQLKFTDVASSIDIVPGDNPRPYSGHFQPQDVRLSKVKRTPI
jgi:hypothetical protein